MARKTSDEIRAYVDRVESLYHEFADYGHSDCYNEPVDALYKCLAAFREAYRKAIAKELDLKL